MNVRLNSLIEAVLTFVISINWERGYCFCAVKPRQTTLIMTKNLTQALYFWKSGFFVCGKMWLCLENGMNALTCQLVNSRTDTLVNSWTCQFLGANFNIMSACFSHQLFVRPQKIDSRGGLFWCKMGVVVNANIMNIYLIAPPSTPIFGLLAAKCSAFCC